MREDTKAMSGVRICTSGGASHAAPGLTTAIFKAYEAMKPKVESLGEEDG